MAEGDAVCGNDLLLSGYTLACATAFVEKFQLDITVEEQNNQIELEFGDMECKEFQKFIDKHSKCVASNCNEGCKAMRDLLGYSQEELVLLAPDCDLRNPCRKNGGLIAFFVIAFVVALGGIAIGYHLYVQRP